MEEGDTTENWLLEKSEEPKQTVRVSRVVPESNTTLDQCPIINNDPSLLPVTNSNSSPVIDSQSKSNTTNLPEEVNSKKLQKLPSWARSWTLWAILLAFAPGSIAFVAISILLKLPSAPNCPSIFWPLASASVRLHCSQLAASKQNVRDLLQAIYLVQHLPKNHPLRSEINRLIEKWSRDILILADLSFQDGKLEEAITTARKIPQDLFTYKLVEEKIKEWQSIWSKAEELYQKAESELRGQQWQSVFMTAANLSQLNNKYWANIKYNQLSQLIAQAREDGSQLAQAKSLAKSKNVNNLLKAIELAESISKDSSIYASAQKLIPDISQIMLDIAQSKLEQQNVDEAISIVQDVPDSKLLREKKEDFIVLAEAQRNAWLGTMSNLKVAISQAQQINPSRPNYEKAQQLISHWELEIEGISYLEKARFLASRGT
ncbi:MAG TPA: chromosome segregation ATPase, partial [Richelia sp.]|nr:chromosome segregation ATPase [Richelia sp.]